MGTIRIYNNKKAKIEFKKEIVNYELFDIKDRIYIYFMKMIVANL